jgi:hypothetical protein
MAYTIQILKWGVSKRDTLLLALQDKIHKDGRFRCSFSVGSVEELPCIILRTIRLVTSKPYCGNHPGPCDLREVGGKKRITPFLEWNDWVAFHGLVNKVCGRLRVNADIWTSPQDAKGKFWIRKGMLPRVRFDYTEEYIGGRPNRIWNTGTPDQFLKE